VYATGTTTARDRGISVLNNCMEWDKFVRLALTYRTPDSCLAYTKPTIFTITAAGVGGIRPKLCQHVTLHYI